jgi:copper chaperone CopZ
MDQVVFGVPAMWADHHTLAVKAALAQVDGVEEVIASPLSKTVRIKYDPATVSSDALGQALAQAGYEPGKAADLPTHPKRIEDASDWYQFQERVTETDGRDLELSGDHRKY